MKNIVAMFLSSLLLIANSSYGITLLAGVGSYNPNFVMTILNNQKTKDSGTTDATPQTNKLVQTGQDFTTSLAGGANIYIAHNVTDDTYTIITAIDSDNTLSVADDIFDTGSDVFTIYDPRITLDGYFAYTPFDSYIDWGDGTAVTNWTVYNAANRTHTYTSIDTFTVTISGYLPTIRFNDAGSRTAIRTIENLGDVGWKFFNSSFLNSTNITKLDLRNSDFSEVSDMSNMLKGITSATVISNIDTWNVSLVTNFTGLFEGMTGLLTEPEVGTWNVSNATNFTSVFMQHTSTSTPPNVANWDVSAGRTFWEMFRNCPWTGPPDVSGWDVTAAEDFNEMFADCASMTTPPDVSSWVTTSLSNPIVDPDHGGGLYRTFKGMLALLTPPDVSGWDTSGCSNQCFYETFYLMSSVTTPPDVSGWDTNSGSPYSSVRMFRDMTSLTTPPDITGTSPIWDTSTFTTITEMFRGLTGLTQPIRIDTFEIDSVTTGSTDWLDFVSNSAINTTVIDGFLLKAYQTSSYGGGGGITASLTWDLGPDASDCYTNSSSVTVGNSGTTTSDTADKLEDNGGTPDFTTTVQQYDCVHNTTDDTWAIVTAVDDNDTLSVSPDIMDTSETYTIEDKTDAECALQALSISSLDNLTFQVGGGSLGACP